MRLARAIGVKDQGLAAVFRLFDSNLFCYFSPLAHLVLAIVCVSKVEYISLVFHCKHQNYDI